eukprot:scaffold1890_cov380-Prasinococcus_capsulatus_cf.AAC.3
MLQSGGIKYYEMEYTVEAKDFYRHNRSVYASASDARACSESGLATLATDKLYTMNVQSPQEEWPALAQKAKYMTESFHILRRTVIPTY